MDRLEIPILLYHRVGAPEVGAQVRGQYVSTGLFAKHLRYLRGRGYQGITVAELARWLRGAPLPVAKPVVITFDDGHDSVRREAWPILTDVGFRATIFVVAAHLGGTPAWEGPADTGRLIPASELAAMVRSGFELGCHTLHHAHLPGLGPDAARVEIGEARRRLEDEFGVECLSFAYPYGEFDEAVRELVAGAGYLAACTTRRGVVRTGDDPYTLPRLNIRRYNWLPRFAHKLRQAHRVRPG